VRATLAAAAKLSLSFNGNNCSTAKTYLIMFSNQVIAPASPAPDPFLPTVPDAAGHFLWFALLRPAGLPFDF
jgi:hypothetical protein